MVIELEMDELKQIVDKLNNNLLSNSFEEGSFVTPAGKVFHENFVSLINFTFFGILTIETVPIGLSFLNFIKGRFKIGELSDRILVKLARETPLTEEETEAVQKLYIEDIKNKDIVEVAEDMIKDNPFYNKDFRAKERLYSHYIISLYAYYDSYVISLFKYIEGNLSNFDYVDVRKINAFEDPKEKLNKLRIHFNLIDKKELDKLLIVKRWETDISKLKDVRDKLVHRDPDAKVIDIRQVFLESNKEAKKITKKFYKHEDFENYPFLKKLLKDFSPILDLLYLLMEIGKNCYGFLAIFDNLIHNYFENTK